MLPVKKPVTNRSRSFVVAGCSNASPDSPVALASQPTSAALKSNIGKADRILIFPLLVMGRDEAHLYACTVTIAETIERDLSDSRVGRYCDLKSVSEYRSIVIRIRH